MRIFPRHQQFLILLGISCVGLIATLLLRFTGDAVLPFLGAVFAGAWLFGFEGGLTVLLFSCVFALLMTVEQTLQGWVQVAELGGLGLAISWVLELSQQQTHRFRSMAASMADAVIATDRGGNVTYMNAQAEALLGKQLARAKRQPLKQLVQFRDHATGGPVEIAIDAVLSGESPSSAAAKRLILSREALDSEVEETIAPMRSRSGRIEGVILTIRDTTRRREAEDQLSRSQKMDALAVLNLAQAGDARAEKIVQHRAGIVSDIIVNLSLILNPGLILLEGEVGSHPTLISGVQKQLQESEFAVTRIGAGQLGNTSVLWGAIAVALEVIPSVLLPQPLG